MDNVLEGYNSTVLAYGVTGAGKTYTIFGDDSNDSNEKGICIYTVDYLFNKILQCKNKLFTVKISYLEIYNEQVFDLLSNTNDVLMVVEDPSKGVLVPDLSEVIVGNSNDAVQLILKGNHKRQIGSTEQNHFSSRSHAILEISIEQCDMNLSNGSILISKILLGDLAGSERGSKEKRRREEGGNINKSLLALGNCINILAYKTKTNSFVPYLNSKLTRILKDSLGGNTATVMIACISPSPLTYEETNSTLKYASKANCIEKKITKNIKEFNQVTNKYRESISFLRSELLRLKEIIKEQHSKIRSGISSMENIFFLKDNNDNNQEDNGLNKLNKYRSVKIIPLKKDINESINNSQKLTKNNSFVEDYQSINESSDNEFIINFNKKIYDIITNKSKNELNEYDINYMTESLEEQSPLKIKLNEEDTIENSISKISNIYFDFIDKIVDIYKNNKSKEDSKIKQLLKNILIKFISSSEKGTPSNILNKLNSISNEKRELIIKTKKYQEYYESMQKENEKKKAEISQLKLDIKKTKNLIETHERNISNYEAKIKDLNKNIKISNFLKKHQSPLSKNLINFKFSDDNSFIEHMGHHRSNSIKNTSKSTNLKKRGKFIS